MEAAKATAPEAARNRRRELAVLWCGVDGDLRDKACILNRFPP